ncbi:MAG TPA: hypothetical protein VIH26_02065 [Anaerolineales bacterium]
MPHPDSGAGRASAYRRGLLTIAALGGLTWVEFQLSGGPVLPLLVIGLAKAALILQFFMHISRLWKQQ